MTWDEGADPRSPEPPSAGAEEPSILMRLYEQLRQNAGISAQPAAGSSMDDFYPTRAKTEGRTAAGWPCPFCGEEISKILDWDLPLLYLECKFCHYQWEETVG